MKRSGIIILLLCFYAAAAFASGVDLQAPQPEAKKATIDLRGINILDFFKIFSKKMNVTIVPSKDISGKINMLLNDIAFEDAFDLIIVSQGLACERNGSVINIMASNEYEKLYGRKYNEKRKFRAFKMGYAKPSAVFSVLGEIKSDIGKLILDEPSATIFVIDTPERISLIEAAVSELDQIPQTEIFQLQYAKCEDIKPHLEGLITKGVGELVTDNLSNKIIVSDLPDKLKRMDRIVRELDAEPLQAVIECNIAEITIKDEYQRQINWEAIFENFKNMDLTGTFPVGASWSVSPTMSTASQLVNVGTLNKDHFTTALKFLETLGDTKIYSHPELLVMSGHEGSILVGSREAYVIQTLSQAAGSTISAEDIQFIDVGIKLNVTPQINRRGFITMKIKPQVSSVRETVTTTLGSRVPIVDTTEVETSVKVADGVIIMIAGLTKQEMRGDTAGIPGFSRMPIADLASGAAAGLKKRTEFVVFLTPHIARSDSSISAKPLNIELQLQDKLKGMKVAETY